ncbi:MAG: hypothetical protein HYY21_04280 [Candidatus Tectomicrobia bacterium]|nr:hypothetical protein [Candidatus Tectomicrobia bacterium]
MKKLLASIAIAAALMATSPAAFAGTWESLPLVDGTLVVSDLIIVRPLSVAYAAVAAVAWPFAATAQLAGGNDIEPITEALIYEPFWFTVQRPVGKFSR